jgi:SAM-dependent methyltransferase
MKCPICSAQTRAFVDESEGIEYRRCSVCAYVHKAPRHHPDWSEQKARYDLHENDPDDPGYRAYFGRFLDWVLPQVDVRGRALDFGSGASDLLSTLLEEAGYDAADRYDPIYHPDSAFLSQTYDLIVSVEVFEHLSDPLETFALLIERLNPGGHIAIRTEFAPTSDAAFAQWYYRNDPTHIAFFTPETFAQMARRTGVRLLAEDGHNKVLFTK